LFKQRKLCRRITFKKTEVILTVLVGWQFWARASAATGFAAIALGVVGVCLRMSGGAEAKGFHLRDFAQTARRGLGWRSGVVLPFPLCPIAASLGGDDRADCGARRG